MGEASNLEHGINDTRNTQEPEGTGRTRNTPNKDAILTLNKLGILKGYEDGTFKPYKEINRAEALKIILESTKLIDKKTKDSKIEFTDVNEKDWYYKYVKKAYELEIVKGYEDGTFKPGQTINLAEMSKILDITGEKLK